MKRNKQHIICAWLLLLCFAAGQWAVYTHQHRIFSSVTKTASQRTAVSEKCQLCDAIHHNCMLTHNHTYITPVALACHVYQPGHYDFISISLILSPGRAPPVA